MKKATVTLPNLFAGEMIGGLEPQQWEKLNNHERLLNRLAFIHIRASAFYSVPYDETSGLPANMHIESLRLAERAQKAIEALQEGDHSTAAWLTLEVGLNLERIKSVLAVAKALDVTKELLDNEENIHRGEKLISGSHSGGNVKNKAFQEKRPKYQPYIDGLYQKNKHLSYAYLQQKAAKEFNVSKETIKRYTQNPKNADSKQGQC